MTQKIPNFFLIGAPKAGTTAMSEYLGSHPQVFFSDPKEPDFFNHDFNNRYVTSLIDYLKLFDNAKDHHIAIGEGSTRYLESSVAITEILDFNPFSKFIVMLRNPIEMAPALHSQYVFEGYEDILDFSKAWRLQDERRSGNKIPGICIEPKMVIYSDSCKLGQHMERLYTLVSPDRVKVIMFDDFRKFPGKEYREVLSFLGLRDDERHDFPVVNENRTYRFPILQEMILRLGGLKRAMGINRGLGLHKMILRWNIKYSPRTTLDQRTKKELSEYFYDDINKLSRIIDRDLSSWLSH